MSTVIMYATRRPACPHDDPSDRCHSVQVRLDLEGKYYTQHLLHMSGRCFCIACEVEMYGYSFRLVHLETGCRPYTPYTQDHRTWWTDDGWVEPDSFAPNTQTFPSCSQTSRQPNCTILRRPIREPNRNT